MIILDSKNTAKLIHQWKKLATNSPKHEYESKSERS